MRDFDLQETLAILGVLGSGIAYLIKASQDAKKENDNRMNRIFEYFDKRVKNMEEMYRGELKDLKKENRELNREIRNIYRPPTEGGLGDK